MFGTFKATKDKALKTRVVIGNKAYVYYMNLGKIAENFEKYKQSLQNAENRLLSLKNQDPSKVQDYNKKLQDAQSQYGAAVLYLFHVVFGEETTERLLEFYDGDYETMLISTIPYIKNRVSKNVSKFLKKLRKQMDLN